MFSGDLDQLALTGRRSQGNEAGLLISSLANRSRQMAATVEELYRNYGILADAKEDLSQVCVPPALISTTILTSHTPEL